MTDEGSLSSQVNFIYNLSVAIMLLEQKETYLYEECKECIINGLEE